MNELFNQSRRYDDHAKRNVIYISKPESAFTNLIDDDDDVNDLVSYQDLANKNIAHNNTIDEDFYYTASIDYPFSTEPYMVSRYSDGSFPVWYGSQDIETTIYETAYYAVKYAKMSGITEDDGVITKKRSLYDVHCNAILIDVVGQEKTHPALISDDYQLTNSIGKEIKHGGYPGLLSPSARHPQGINLNIFKKEVLSHPSMLDSMEYRINLNENILEVIQDKKNILTINV